MYDENYNLIDYVYFSKLQTQNKSCVHSGDDREGKNKEGDNEVISINMDLLDKNIKYIFPVMNVYSGQSSFNKVKGAYCRILDS